MRLVGRWGCRGIFRGFYEKGFMNLIRINGELLCTSDVVEPGATVGYRRIGDFEGIPLVEIVDVSPAEYVPAFASGPGNTGMNHRDPELDGEKRNQMENDQRQVEGRPLVGQLPVYRKKAQQENLYESDEAVFLEDDEARRREKEPVTPGWQEAEVEGCQEVGGLLLLTIGGKKYLVVYDDECRRAGMGVGARISYRMMPSRSTSVPGVGRMDVDEIQLGNVLIPAPRSEGESIGKKAGWTVKAVDTGYTGTYDVKGRLIYQSTDPFAREGDVIKVVQSMKNFVRYIKYPSQMILKLPIDRFTYWLSQGLLEKRPS